MDAPPEVSVIISAYESHATVVQCLECLRRQTFRDFEIILVDSSPVNQVAPLLDGAFPDVTVLYSPSRLLPHAARNLGVERARGTLLVFTDADAFADVDWLARLVAAQRAHGGVITGGVRCAGGRWLHRGIHLNKFDKWLPGGPTEPTDIAPTVNMLISRADFERGGRFDAQEFLADTTFSWYIRSMGVPIWRVPDAVVAHQHVTGFRAFIRERFERGQDFALLRTREGSWSRVHIAIWLAVSLIPFRAVKLTGRSLRNALRSRISPLDLTALPVTAAGHLAWVWGEAAIYQRLIRRER